MKTLEETAAKIGVVTNGTGRRTEVVFRAKEESAPANVVSDLQSVKDLAVVEGSSKSSLIRDHVTLKDVKKEVVEERVGGESKATANGDLGTTKEEGREETALFPEIDGVVVLPHWRSKPCVHITGLGGVVTEEDLVQVLSVHGRIVSIVFETERRDSAIVRYEPSGSQRDDVVAKVRETVNNKEIRAKTLVVEPFRPDSLLFIGNLTPEIDDAVLRQMFQPHGIVERAFVLRNAGGRSKGYGFVEYSLKAEASAAKVAMGNINMDGRVLRVEWSDCRKISDMFSTVLFVDRIPKDFTHIEQALRKVFGQFGKVKDCHLAIGLNQQLRGFAFIDYMHSSFADKAHEALDGHEVEGTNIRVSFANPSKSAQSYKSRFGVQPPVQPANNHGTGTFPGVRGHSGMPRVGNQFISHGGGNMLGITSIGLQFGRGAAVGPGMIGRNLLPPLMGNTAGMLGVGSLAVGMIRGPGTESGHSGQRGVGGSCGYQGSRIPSGRGPVPINSAAIAQVAAAQAKAREEDAKARAEAQAQQSWAGPQQSAAEQERLEQFQKMAAQQAQLTPQHNYYQHHSQPELDDQYKQARSQYSYQRPAQLQTTPHAQYQHQSASQQGAPPQQTQQSYNSQYYAQPLQQYAQLGLQQQQQFQPQQQQHPLAKQVAYYQQSAQRAAQASEITHQQSVQYASQCGQQYSQQYQQQQEQQQQYVQPQQCTETTQQQQPQTQYTQQDYSNFFHQQPLTQPSQSPRFAVAIAVTGTGTSPAQAPDSSQQQQAYAANDQQRAQDAVMLAETNAQTTSDVGSQASLEAQWAAYYAAQAAHQQATGTISAYEQQQTSYTQQHPQSATAGYYQQPATAQVGLKRPADQIDYPPESQASYAYQQQQPIVSTDFQLQPASATSYQQTALANYQPASYQLQAASAVLTFPLESPAVAGYASALNYQQSATPPSGYQQSLAHVVAGYEEQSATAVSVYSQPNQTAVPAPAYDYTKRPRH